VSAQLVVSILLALGGGLGIGTLVTSRSVARKTTAEGNSIDAKLPAEVDSIVVQGAEAAVLTMQAALTSATARIVQLEASAAEDARRIRELETRLDELRRKVEMAEHALEEARQASVDLRAELANFRSNRP